VGISLSSTRFDCPENWRSIQFDACPGLPRFGGYCRIYRLAATQPRLGQIGKKLSVFVKPAFACDRAQQGRPAEYG
jgi:hypothetical protein